MKIVLKKLSDALIAGKSAIVMSTEMLVRLGRRRLSPFNHEKVLGPDGTGKFAKKDKAKC